MCRISLFVYLQMAEYLRLPDEIQDVIDGLQDIHNEIEDTVGH